MTNIQLIWLNHVAAIKEEGYCGELSPTGRFTCGKQAGHDGEHDWETKDEHDD